MTAKKEPTVLERLWGYGDLASRALVVSGAFATVFVGRAGAAVMLAGLLAALMIHLAIGVIAYRRVMAREWPKVAPLDEDDEW